MERLIGFPMHVLYYYSKSSKLAQCYTMGASLSLPMGWKLKAPPYYGRKPVRYHLAIGCSGFLIRVVNGLFNSWTFSLNITVGNAKSLVAQLAGTC